MLAPNTLDCLFTLMGSPNPPVDIWGDCGAELGWLLDKGNAEETLRRPKPKRFPGLGGSGGGWSSELLVLLVVPVSVRIAGALV